MSERGQVQPCGRWQPNVGSSLKADPPLRCGELAVWAKTGRWPRRSGRPQPASGITEPSSIGNLTMLRPTKA
jgi:hypothetical protein